MTSRSSARVDEPTLIRSLARTSSSALRLFVELWYATWHDAHH
jgi:hypothetical protein